MNAHAVLLVFYVFAILILVGGVLYLAEARLIRRRREREARERQHAISHTLMARRLRTMAEERTKASGAQVYPYPTSRKPSQTRETARNRVRRDEDTYNPPAHVPMASYGMESSGYSAPSFHGGGGSSGGGGASGSWDSGSSSGSSDSGSGSYSGGGDS